MAPGIRPEATVSTRPRSSPTPTPVCSPAARNGTESAAAHDDDIEEYLHLYLSNRGVLITPFHNMALMCPQTSATDVDLHSELFEAAVQRII